MNKVQLSALAKEKKIEMTKARKTMLLTREHCGFILKSKTYEVMNIIKTDSMYVQNEVFLKKS